MSRSALDFRFFKIFCRFEKVETKGKQKMWLQTKSRYEMTKNKQVRW